MGHIGRRRRATCQLRCEVVRAKGHSVQGRIVTISEGGIELVTALPFDQGDPVRLLIKGEAAAKPVLVSAIIWNNRSAGDTDFLSRLNRFGCVVSEPSRAFLALLDGLAPQPKQTEAVPIARPRTRIPKSGRVEPDLPRSRVIEPPPKPEPEETLPYFRVRLKQVGGPRTRMMTLRARSASQVENLARNDLASICKDSVDWEVLHVTRVSKSH